MTQGSVRLHLPGIHQHDEDLDSAPGAPRPSSPECDDGPVPVVEASPGRLWRDGDELLYQCEGGEPTPARVLWARPLTGRDGALSIMAAGKKKELAFLSGLDALDPESRKIAEEELGIVMVLPRITAVREVKPRFGNYYWDVETDRGPRLFLLTSPENNHQRTGPDSFILKDVSGNCYEINPVSSLDRRSLRELDRVL